MIRSTAINFDCFRKLAANKYDLVASSYYYPVCSNTQFVERKLNKHFLSMKLKRLLKILRWDHLQRVRNTFSALLSEVTGRTSGVKGQVMNN